MNHHDYRTAPTKFIEANGIRFAYRRVGAAQGTPLVCLQHFTGTMDNWDPTVVDGLAQDRSVILFNNAGVSSSGGSIPSTVAEMARDAASFIEALGFSTVDLFGFSLGGMIAQQIALEYSSKVRRLVLVGTGPRGGEGMASFSPEVQEIFGKTYAVPDEIWLEGFFTPSASSQEAGHAFLSRIRSRKEDRDPPINDAVIPAQLGAVAEWGAPREGSYAYLREIHQPTLVINGSNDIIIPTINSFVLQQEMPNAQLILYPDSNHGSQYQYPEIFIDHVGIFLGDPEN